MASKKCSKCEEKKPLKDFGKHKVAKDGLKLNCRACVAAYNREYKKKIDGIAGVGFLRW